MSPTEPLKKNVNVKELLNQYDDLFLDYEAKEQLEEEILNNEKKLDNNIKQFPKSTDSHSLIAFNNKENPQISIFDAYAFNEVMRRYENSIVQLTKQELLIKDNDQIAKEYDEKISQIKSEYEDKLSIIDDVKEKEEQLRETLDQINVILDEKDEKIFEYTSKVENKDCELKLIARELRDKEEMIKKMEEQLYSVLFNISEVNTLV